MRLRPFVAAAALGLIFGLVSASAPVLAATKKAAAKTSPKTATKATAAKGSTAAKALPPPSGSKLSDAQLNIATLVLTGPADCEFKQTVLIEPIVAQAGTFRVKYRNAVYTMVPEETSTGAVRLYDSKAGVVWLQIPVKSMLMNTRIGQRMVDACTHPAQRLALAQAEAEAAKAALAAATAASAASAAEAASAAASAGMPTNAASSSAPVPQANASDSASTAFPSVVPPSVR